MKVNKIDHYTVRPSQALLLEGITKILSSFHSTIYYEGHLRISHLYNDKLLPTYNLNKNYSNSGSVKSGLYDVNELLKYLISYSAFSVRAFNAIFLSGSIIISFLKLGLS